ncbi:DUF4326 domain-containing protein [Microcoleus sp. D2_18a_D3]|uniref:DUF4326 domain-containing protein n=1 Tax=Microcoleus sp. D2_18a_D3 TaxID=3055330 RepID=UPI002FD36286
MIEVVNGKQHGFVGENKIYIGRANKGLGLKSSPLANPYKIGVDGNRAEVIALYRKWLWNRMLIGYNNPNETFNELFSIAHRVKKKENIKLSCYCKPLDCHGDVLVKCINWIVSEKLN